MSFPPPTTSRSWAGARRRRGSAGTVAGSRRATGASARAVARPFFQLGVTSRMPRTRFTARTTYTPADRPPAVAGLLHEREALQPARLTDRRRIAAEAPAVQLEAEQLQPVAQPQEADEVAAPGVIGPLAPEPALEAPQAERVEAGDHDLPLGHEHPLGLAQDLVRVLAELEHVRQHDEVHALRRERQMARIGGDAAAGLGARAEAVRDAAGAEEVDRRQTDLRRVEAEDVFHGAVELGALPLEDIGALRRLVPRGERRLLRRGWR